MGASGMIEVVAFACRGTLVDWAGAIEAVAYELARRNGESPLDRGAMLRRRVEALADGHGLSRGFERLARERCYRVGKDGDELLAKVVARRGRCRGRARPWRWRSGPAGVCSPCHAVRAPQRSTSSATCSRKSWRIPPRSTPIRTRSCT